MKSKSLRRLLIASLCVVYKDILPTYKIRLPTEQELKQKVLIYYVNIWTTYLTEATRSPYLTFILCYVNAF